MPNAAAWAGCPVWPLSAAANRLGGYEGVRVARGGQPHRRMTGFGFGAASAKDQTLAETCFALRQTPHPTLRSRDAPAQAVCDR